MPPSPLAPDPPAGAVILDDVRAFISRFASLPTPAALDAVTLFIAHSHVVGSDDRLALSSSPRLGLLSDLPASGKTRILELIANLAHNGKIILDPTPASYALTVSQLRATICLDEVDIYFGAGAKNSSVRAFLNAGYRAKGAEWIRANKDPVSIFSAVAFAGLGRTFRTSAALSALRSRTIMIEMRPLTPPEPYQSREHDRTADALRDNLSRWALANAGRICEAWPQMPAGIVDRNADLAQPLLAVAEVAGGHWKASAASAMSELLLGLGDSAPPVPLSTRLVSDLRIVFGDSEKMSTVDIVEALRELPGTPWAELWQNPAGAPRALSSLLSPLGAEPVAVSIGTGAGRQVLRGYRRADLTPLWSVADADPVADDPGPVADAGDVAA